MTTTIFDLSHEEAFKELGAMQPRQQWSMFNVPTKGISKAESPFLLTTIWNYHSEKDDQGKRIRGDIAICQDRRASSYWYCMTNATPKISRQTHVAHMRRIELAFKLHVPVIGILKDVESGKCASSQIFDCPEIRESIDGESTWIRLLPRNDVACLTQEIDIDQLARPSPISFDDGDHATPDHAIDFGWSDSELRASVTAYLDMAHRLRDKQPVVKTQVYRSVAAEIGRSEKSIEYRMQNISYVLALIGRDWIQGLPPAKNVGANVATAIERLIGELENRPTAPLVGNAVEISKIRKALKECPAGNKSPGTTTSSTTSFVRDPKVKAWVLERAKGMCEACAQPAPFFRRGRLAIPRSPPSPQARGWRIRYSNKRGRSMSELPPTPPFLGGRRRISRDHLWQRRDLGTGIGGLMESIIQHSIVRAADEAVKIWALSSTQYPKQHDLILELATSSIIETISAFALNARRALEVLPHHQKIALRQPRWQWTPASDGETVSDLWDALNRIIHAKKLDVGFEELPRSLAVIAEGSLVVPYIRAATDRKRIALIDPFSLSHAFLYDALPIISSTNEPRSSLLKH